MKLENINPFIRYAAQIYFHPENETYVSKDCRLFFFKSNKGKIEVCDKTYSISKNMLIIWQSGTPYKFISSKPIRLISINFDLTRDNSSSNLPFFPIVKKHSKNFSFHKESFEDIDALNSPIFLPDALPLTAQINNIIDTYSLKHLYFEEKASAFLKSLLLDIVVMIMQPFSNTDTDNNLEQIIRYIHSNYQNNLSNIEIAKIAGYHPYYLNLIFKQSIGMTLHQYLNNYRISHAEKLLISTNDSITSIATQVGYNNSISFTQNFKKKNNMTPSTYRETFNKLV